ncbi:MAG: PAS domain-containing protein [Pseudomonadota bacterium]
MIAALQMTIDAPQLVSSEGRSPQAAQKRGEATGRNEKLRSIDAERSKIDRYAMLQKSAPIVLAINLFAAFIITAAGWDRVNNAVLGAWFGTMVVLTIFGAGYWWLQTKASTSRQSLFSYTRKHVVWMGLTGVMWGVLAPFFALHDFLGVAVFPLVIAFLTASVAASAATSWRAAQAFSIPTLAPLCAAYLIFDEANGALIAALVICYLGALADIGWAMQQTIMRLIRQRIRSNNIADTLKRQLEAANDAESRYRALVETSHEATLIFSPDGEIIFANKAAENALGAPAQSLIGRSSKSLLHPDDFGVFKALGARALSKLGDATPVRDLAFSNDSGGYVRMSGRLINLLYAPGVEGFVFCGVPSAQYALNLVRAAG